MAIAVVTAVIRLAVWREPVWLISGTSGPESRDVYHENKIILNVLPLYGGKNNFFFHRGVAYNVLSARY